MDKREKIWNLKHHLSVLKYDQFALSEAERKHTFCHCNEPVPHLHIRNTFLDDRFKKDSPATGVSRFDAFSFDGSKGKRLPLEEEWQRAAEGDEKLLYPWGNEFNKEKVWGIHSLVGEIPTSAKNWRSALRKLMLNSCAKIYSLVP